MKIIDKIKSKIMPRKSDNTFQGKKVQVAKWKVGNAYKVDDKVKFRGKTYLCLLDNKSSLTNTPLLSKTCWKLLGKDDDSTPTPVVPTPTPVVPTPTPVAPTLIVPTLQ